MADSTPSPLTTGLLAGYAGKTTFSPVDRAGFSFLSSDYQETELTYHDEWLNAHNGGGQEVVRTPQGSWTRLYAGGVLAESDLKTLGISEKEVIEFLQKVLKTYAGESRLFENFAVGEDPWLYEYELLHHDSAVDLTFGKESILYTGTVVFAHGFLISPIR